MKVGYAIFLAALATVTCSIAQAQENEKFRDITEEGDIMNEPLPGAGAPGSAPAPADIPVRQLPDAGAFQKKWDDVHAGDTIKVIDDALAREIKLDLRTASTTHIRMPENEVIVDYVLADQKNFQLKECQQVKNCLFIWPKRPGFDTTLHVVVNTGHSYVFYLRGHAYDAEVLPYTKVQLNHAPLVNAMSATSDGAGIQGSAPKLNPQPGAGDLADNVEVTNIPEWVRETSFSPLKLRKDRDIRPNSAEAQAEIAPIDVWRDDKFTYLYYGPNSDHKKWPAVFRVVDGMPERVRRRKDKNDIFLVIETTDNLELIRGDLIVCITAQ